MGGSVSCICDPSSTIKNQILVMKEDGEFLKFKEGIRVKEILVAHPYHKVIRCCTDRAVLPQSFQLSCNQLYFLLPRGLALHDETYKRLLALAASRNPKTSIIGSGRNYGNSPTDTGLVVVAGNKDSTSSDDDYSGYHKSQWKPALRTIPEVTSSPIMHSSVE